MGRQSVQNLPAGGAGTAGIVKAGAIRAGNGLELFQHQLRTGQAADREGHRQLARRGDAEADFVVNLRFAGGTLIKSSKCNTDKSLRSILRIKSYIMTFGAEKSVEYEALRILQSMKLWSI